MAEPPKKLRKNGVCWTFHKSERSGSMEATESREYGNPSREHGMDSHVVRGSARNEVAYCGDLGDWQQQVESRARGGRLDVEAAADDFRAMPHAGDPTTGAFAAEACAVVTHADVDVLARYIQSGLYVDTGRAGVFHDVGKRLLQDTQNVQDV